MASDGGSMMLLIGLLEVVIFALFVVIVKKVLKVVIAKRSL